MRDFYCRCLAAAVFRGFQYVFFLFCMKEVFIGHVFIIQLQNNQKQCDTPTDTGQTVDKIV